MSLFALRARDTTGVLYCTVLYCEVPGTSHGWALPPPPPPPLSYLVALARKNNMPFLDRTKMDEEIEMFNYMTRLAL